jgi:AmmeMemoRadiSam system protein B
MAGPKLRRLERLRLRRDDEELLVLRDPLELAEPFAVDVIYEPVLDALDGQRTLAQIRQSLLMRGVVTVELEDLEEFVAELGQVGLLDDDRFRELWSELHEVFVEEEIRAPRRAGLLYPEDPAALREWLAPALPGAGAKGAKGAGAKGAGAKGAGAEEVGPGYGGVPIAVVVAHQPPPILAGSLRRLLASLPAPEQYRRVVILATDHAPGLLPYASADKDWATPLGPVACDLELLAKLDARLPWLLREQTRLRSADPIEWATLLLRALWGDRCPPILPLACGQTRLTSQDGAERAHELITELADLLGPATQAGEVLWWTAAELSHVGPAYGHAQLPTREQVEAEDRRLLEPLLDNQPEALARACMERPATSRPSGAAALTTLADVLPSGYRAALLGLDVVPAPGHLPGWIGCATVRVT